jgi:predicted lipoprotein
MTFFNSKMALLVPASIITGLLSGCLSSTSSSSSTSNPALDKVVQEMVDEHIMPATQSLSQNTQSLFNKSDAYCTDATFSESELTSLQNQWVATQNAWYAILPFNFGPLETPDDLTTPAFWYIDSYRVRGDNEIAGIRTDITTLLADSSGITNGQFANKTYNKVGLLALEVLLFERSDNQSNVLADINSEFSNTARKCQLLTGQAFELNRRVQIISDAWSSDYNDTSSSYRDLLINHQLEALTDDDGSTAITKITVAIQNYYDYLNKREVADEVAQLSSSIWAALTSSIESTNNALNGGYINSTASNSILQLMIDYGNNQDVETVRGNIQDFKQSITDEDKGAMKIAAATIDGNMKREIPDALGISLGINFSDGD